MEILCIKNMKFEEIETDCLQYRRYGPLHWSVLICGKWEQEHFDSCVELEKLYKEFCTKGEENYGTRRSNCGR
jgi:hypothetical protein